MRLRHLAEWDEDHEEGPDIDSVDLNDVMFHGTSFDPDSGPFTDFDYGYSEWGAIWVTDAEAAAEEFATQYGNDRTPIVYRVRVSANRLAVIDMATAEELTNWCGEDDLRDTIPALERMGFRGWKTTGSIGQTLYDDYAIFSGDLDILDAKVMVNGKWTEYVPLDEIGPGAISESAVFVDVGDGEVSATHPHGYLGGYAGSVDEVAAELEAGADPLYWKIADHMRESPYERVAFLTGFEVDDAHRSTGVGSQMLADVMHTLASRGFDAVYLSAGSSGRQADLERFYRKHGFEAIERDDRTGWLGMVAKI